MECYTGVWHCALVYIHSGYPIMMTYEANYATMRDAAHGFSMDSLHHDEDDLLSFASLYGKFFLMRVSLFANIGRFPELLNLYASKGSLYSVSLRHFTESSKKLDMLRVTSVIWFLAPFIHCYICCVRAREEKLAASTLKLIDESSCIFESGFCSVVSAVRQLDEVAEIKLDEAAICFDWIVAYQLMNEFVPCLCITSIGNEDLPNELGTGQQAFLMLIKQLWDAETDTNKCFAKVFVTRFDDIADNGVDKNNDADT
ncbi:hypothetical protein AKJ16_DCAP13138 [Drosera capensis]